MAAHDLLLLEFKGKIKGKYINEPLMSFAIRFVLSLALLACLLPAPVRASEYEVDTSLVCDTQAQVERFAAVFAGDAQDAIRVVNAEEQNPSACVIENVAYMRGTRLEMVRHGDSAFEIVRVLVIGIETENGILPVRPSVYFSLFSVKEYGI
jgi:hypothetical protein